MAIEFPDAWMSANQLIHTPTVNTAGAKE